ncbi:hypothetical protein MFIFM68171_02071 [Madurella fahalii]|uniref:Rhodopsin domain-containing protein n=1 Tax=Madurella fahalii TaxID=1157608 RepID=A0ABQ0G2A0_9PEZI
MAPSAFSAQRSVDAVAPTKEDLSGTIIACAGIMMALSTLAVALRFYVRLWMFRTVASEDWCILAAWVFTLVATGGTVKEAQLALGRHMDEVPPENIGAFLHTTYIKTLFYNLSLFLTKVSILLLYLRVLKTFDYLRKAMWVTLGVVVVCNIWALAMYFSMCIPLRKMWEPTVDGYCHPYEVWWTLMYIHIVTDFVIFLLPIPVVVTMTIPRPQKVGLLFVFCVGFFVCLISILRAIWLNARYPRPDMTWDLTSIANWSSVEINIAIVCACLTTLKPLFQKFFRPWIDRLLSPRTGSETGCGSRPLTIGSSPLQAFRARYLRSPRHTTTAEGIAATVVELGTAGTSTLGKMKSSDAEDTCGQSGA